MVEGEAGIGKSRLVSEFLAAPPGRRRTSLVAVCPPFGQPQTLAPIVDAVHRAVDEVANGQTPYLYHLRFNEARQVPNRLDYTVTLQSSAHQPNHCANRGVSLGGGCGVAG